MIQGNSLELFSGASSKACVVNSDFENRSFHAGLRLSNSSNFYCFCPSSRLQLMKLVYSSGNRGKALLCKSFLFQP